MPDFTNISEPISQETIYKFLAVTAFDYNDHAWWRFDDSDPRRLMLFVRCDDVFAWGCADLEQVTDDNIDSLVATVAECEAILEPVMREKSDGKVGGRYSADDAYYLWCARQRGIRPQGALYKRIEPALRHLFDAAGPVRDVNFANPVDQSKAVAQ